MRLDDFRIGLRHLVREPGYSAIAILGLSVGFAACLLLLGSRFEKQPPPLETSEDDLLDLPESLLQKLPLPRSDKQAVL